MANLNPIITDLLNNLNIEDYEKEFIISALNIEYKNTDKDRPQLKTEYFSLIEKAYTCKKQNK